MVATKPPPRRASSTNSRRSARPSAEVGQFQRFCLELRTDKGAVFTPYPEQLELLAPYFDGARESIVILPKKNGKSTLVAALALYHLLVTPDAECIIVAAARDQAEIILRQANIFIRRSPELRARMKVLRREIQSLEDEGRVRVLASDEDTADGVLPSLAIVDELHRHRTGGLYTVLRLAIGTTGGRMITISTAGASMASPLGEKRQRAYAMEGFKRDTKRRRSFVRSADGSFAFIEWCLNPDDDPTDMKIVKLVNPAPWKTLELLAEEHDSVTPWEWLRLACGIWTEGSEPGIDPELWDPLGRPGLVIPDRAEVTVGVDLAPYHAGAGIAIIQATEEGYVGKVRLLRGKDVPLSAVEAEVRDISARYIVRQIVHDTQGFGRSAELLASEGFPVLEAPQSPERMTAASETFYKLMEEGRFHHDGDPELRAQAMAVRVKQVERGWRYQKDPALVQPVDGLFALMVALHRAETEPPAWEPMFRFGR